MSNFSFPAGIKGINLHPISGSIVISYDPECLDILGYLEKLVKDEAFLVLTEADEKR